MPTRGLAAAVAVALAASLCAPAVAKVKTGNRAEYVTTYSGTYTFTQAFHSTNDKGQPGQDLTTDQKESFVSVDHNTITISRSGRFKNVHELSLELMGHVRQIQVQGYGVDGGPFTTTVDCTARTVSDKPARSEGGGVGVLPVPVSKNPVLQVGWEIPDYGNKPVTGVPPVRIDGTSGCDEPSSNSFLDCVPGSCATVQTLVPMTRQVTRAFSGTANIHYSQLPWSDTFEDLEAVGHTDTTGNAPSTEDAKVVVDTAVEILRWDLPPRSKEKVDKFAALIAEDVYPAIFGQGRPGGGPAGSSGDTETVVVPPIGQGNINLNVSGIVVAPRVEATASTVLATGKVTFGKQPAPGRMTITPTAAGHKLLASPHPALKLRYAVTFTPRGSKNSVTRAKVVDVPAFTG